MEEEPPIEFIHVPQTGGEAIENAYPEYKWGSLRFPPFDYSRRSICHQALNLRYLFQNKTCFGVIRDPFERILEIYKRWEYPDNPVVFNQTIEKWAEIIKTIPYFLDNNLRPQSELLELCKHILLYDEFLEDNLQKLLTTYNLPKRILAPENVKTRYYRVNKTSFSPFATSWIREFYKSDFDLLDKVVLAEGLYSK